MRKIILVACASKKRTSAAPAESLYASALFRKSREYAIRQLGTGDVWFILSAKYGLLDPTTVIQPYDESLNRATSAEREEWAKKVMAKLEMILRPGDAVVFLAGLKYRKLLEGKVRDLGCETIAPMKGLRIGEQLGWLS